MSSLSRDNLHILFVTGEYPPMQGGVGAYTAELGAALVELGVEVTVLTAQKAAGAQADTGVRVLPVVARWGFGLWQEALRQARRVGATRIHVQYQTAAFAMHPAINFAPWWWRGGRGRKGLPVAWTYHDLMVPYLFPKAGRRLRTWATHFPARVCAPTIVTNEGDRLQLAQHGLHACKSPIGSNITARFFDDSARHRLRQARGFNETDVVVGYFGFMNRSKGGLTLVQTLDALVHAGVPAHLLMIGERVGASDPDSFIYLRKVVGEITQRKLGPRVSWTGRLEDADVSAALAVCDVLLMPYEDGVSLRRGTLMAGLAHGCAVVTTFPRAPLSELTDGVHLRYVPPRDPAAAAQAVQEIVNDAALAQKLRQGAQEVSRLFTWQTIARQHLEFYAQFHE